MTRCSPSAFVAAVLVLMPAGFALSEDWPGWRGADRNGVSSEADLPLHWSATRNVDWNRPLPGFGISSAVISGDRVFITASDGHRLSNLHLIALSREDGDELWHQQFWGTAPTRYHNNKSSMASPAPVTDGRQVFAFYGTGDVFCTSVDGVLQWHRSLAEEFGRIENRFAASSSPLLYRDTVLIQCDHYGDSYVIAIDKASGATRWKIDRPDYWLSWASPRLVPVGTDGRQELIVAGSQRLDALDPETGEALWSVRGMRRECIPTPVFGNGMIYAVSGPKGPTLAIRPGGRGDVTDTHVVWSNNRGAPFVPSAILVGDHYYLVDDQGIATCLDAHSGSRHWQKRLGGAYTASPVAGDGKIYFADESGTTVVIAAGTDDYRELARNDVGQPVYATPSISQGRVFVRTTQGLFCVGPSKER